MVKQYSWRRLLRLFSRRILRLVVIAGWFGIGSVDAQMDWSQLRGPNRDGISQETGLLKSWPKKGLHVLSRMRSNENWN